MADDQKRGEAQVKDSGRRALLKAATVAGGAVAASALLPGSWRKPVATIGGLPAHAQMSQAITIRRVSAAYRAWPVPPPSGQLAGVIEADIGVYCEYEDSFGDFDLNHMVTYLVTPGLVNGAEPANGACGPQQTSAIKDLPKPPYWDGNKYKGELWLGVYGGCCPADTITLHIHGAGHTSNEVKVKVQPGPGCIT